MSGIILLSSKGKAPGLLRLRLATASLLAMTGEKTFYEAIKIEEINFLDMKTRRKIIRLWRGGYSWSQELPSFGSA